MKSWNIYQDKLGAFTVLRRAEGSVARRRVIRHTDGGAGLYGHAARSAVAGDIRTVTRSSFRTAFRAEPVVTVANEGPTKDAFKTTVELLRLQRGRRPALAGRFGNERLRAEHDGAARIHRRPEARRRRRADGVRRGVLGHAGCREQGGINIPTVEGIDYFIDDQLAAGGVHEFFAAPTK